MSLPSMGSFEARHAGLVACGIQFPHQYENSHAIPLGADGLAYVGRKGEPTEARIDSIAAQESTFAALDPRVHRALGRLNLTLVSPDDLHSILVDEVLADDSIIVGFSGYASGSMAHTRYEYSHEAPGIGAALHNKVKPGRAVHGGTSTGIPGLAGLIAQQNGVGTVGCLPLQGLGCLSPNNLTIIKGQNFGDETELLCALPDVLLVFGGAKNTEDEARQTVRMGGTVLVAALKGYRSDSFASPHRYGQVQAEAEAAGQGELIVCDSVEKIQGQLVTLRDSGLHLARRAQRKAALGAILQPDRT